MVVFDHSGHTGVTSQDGGHCICSRQNGAELTYCIHKVSLPRGSHSRSIF